MTFAIETDDSKPDPDKYYTFPTALQWPAEERPKMYFRSPMGSDYQDWRAMQAEYEDARDAYLEETELPSEEEARAARPDGSFPFLEVLGEDVDPEEVEAEQILSVRDVQERLAVAVWRPPEELFEWFVGFCVEFTQGLYRVPYRNGQGEQVPLDWRNDEQLEGLLGQPADQARRMIIESFGGAAWEKAETPINYAAYICNHSGLGADQKKD